MEPKLELLKIDCLGKQLRLEGSLAGWQQLFWDNNLVSQKAAAVDNGGLKVHVFELTHHSSIPALEGGESANTVAVTPIQMRLEIDLV